MLNSEKYKTAEERARAFNGYCDAMCKHDREGCDPASCVLEWLEFEALEEKPLPCPFCGGKALPNCGHMYKDGELHWVDCVNDECMYRSAHYTDKSKAIAAHNSVARAVMAAGKDGSNESE